MPRFPSALPVPHREAAPGDLPPSATTPRSTPRPPGPNQAGPPHGAEGTVRFDEPWRRAEPVRRRAWLRPVLLGVAAVAVAGLVAAEVMVLVEHDASSPHTPLARLAGNVFTSDPAAGADGRDQELAGVASAGSIVVATGDENDGDDSRPEFLVSVDGGRSFRSAEVRASDDGEPGHGDVPRVVAGSGRSWVALGDAPGGTAVWTSRDGKRWTVQPDAAGAAFGHDKIARVAATSGGFVAVGDTSATGDYSDAVPVVWLSSDARHWERLGNDQLKLSLPGGPLSLIDVAAHGDTVLVYGWTTDHKGGVARDGVWRSEDGGRTWAQAEVPHPKGTAGPGIAIAATPAGFVAGRNAKGRSERYGVVMTSPDGRQWQTAGEIHLPGYGGLQRLAGSDRGLAAVIGGDKKLLLARSGDGRSWQNAGEVAMPTGRAVTGVAVTGGATIVAGRESDVKDLNAVLAVRDTLGQEVAVDPARIPGAVRPDRAVTAVAAGRGVDVAVGGTNGDAAAWRSGDGDHWSRARPIGDTAQGRQRLLDVTPGAAGWLAVGYDATRPLVVTSADGATWRTVHDGFSSGSDGHIATYAAASGPAGYVVVGESGFSAATWRSADLTSWRQSGSTDLDGTHAANRWMRAVVGGPFGYVAVGGLSDPAIKDAPSGRPAVWTSPDGATWTLRRLPQPSGSLEGWFGEVTARGKAIVATGTATTASGHAAFAFVSTDGGGTWQEIRLPVPDRTDADTGGDTGVTAATVTTRGFVVAGDAGAPGRTDVVLWTSADGRSWSAESPRGTGLSGRGDQSLTGLTATGSDLLGVGVTMDQRGEEPTLWRRPAP